MLSPFNRSRPYPAIICGCIDTRYIQTMVNKKHTIGPVSLKVTNRRNVVYDHRSLHPSIFPFNYLVISLKDSWTPGREIRVVNKLLCSDIYSTLTIKRVRRWNYGVNKWTQTFTFDFCRHPTFFFSLRGFKRRVLEKRSKYFRFGCTYTVYWTLKFPKVRANIKIVLRPNTTFGVCLKTCVFKIN